MKIAINVLNKELTNYDYVIGVEQGALSSCNIAIADFDSLDIEELKIVKSKKHIILPTDKDENDVEAAIKHAKKLNPKSIDIYLPKAFNRIDHLLTNIILVYKYNVKLIIDQTLFFLIEVETIIPKCLIFSLYSFKKGNLEIKNAKFNFNGTINILDTMFGSNSSDGNATIKCSVPIICYQKNG